MSDPRTQSEDLSDNSVKASEYGIKNLKRIVANLPEWTSEEADRYSNLAQMYGQVVGQFNRYMGHVLRNVGGYYETPKSIEQTGTVFEATPKAVQKEAVAFLNKQIFETPTWLQDPKILDNISSPLTDQIGSIQNSVLSSLLTTARLSRMSNASSRFQNTYKVDELFGDLKKGIWSELAAKKTIEANRRNLQKSYVESMISLLGSTSTGAMTMSMGPDPKKSDITSIVRAHLASLRTEINAAAASTSDNMSKYHLQDVSERIKRALDPK
jgi:hypothetical protein